MKLFKNPLFALLLCLLLIVGSTCLNVRIKMEKRYDRVCDELYEEILEFADENGLGELKNAAHSAASAGDYRSMISAYSVYGANYKDADDVDEAIRDYTKFLRKTQQFPASVFVDLLNIDF